MQNKEFFIDKDGCRIHAKLDVPVNTKEKMPVVILVHGLTGHMEEDHIIAAKDAAVSQGYAVVRVEMYGHGLSDGSFTNHTILEWLSQLLFIIDHVKAWTFVSDLYLMGHSQGGYTIMLAAALKGDQISGIVPMSPATAISDYCRTGHILGVDFDMTSIPKTLTLKPGYVLGENYIRTASVLPVEEAIRKYHGPVLLIHGTEDDAIPVRCSEEAARWYENAELVLIPDDGHCYENHLNQVVDALKQWFDQQNQL